MVEESLGGVSGQSMRGQGWDKGVEKLGTLDRSGPVPFLSSGLC